MASLSDTRNKIQAILSSFMHEKDQFPQARNGSTTERDINENSDLLSMLCQPRNRENFYERVETFSIWPMKPLYLSPQHCALYGWENTDVDLLTCVSCKATLDCMIGTEWDTDTYNSTCADLRSSIINGHSKFCPWKETPCSESFLSLPKRSTQEWKEIFECACRNLLSLDGNLPVLKREAFQDLDITEDILSSLSSFILSNDASSYSQDVIDTACVLALCGWNISEKDSAGILCCTSCCREAGLWNFHSLKKVSSIQSEQQGDREVPEGTSSEGQGLHEQMEEDIRDVQGDDGTLRDDVGAEEDMVCDVAIVKDNLEELPSKVESSGKQEHITTEGMVMDNNVKDRECEKRSTVDTKVSNITQGDAPLNEQERMDSSGVKNSSSSIECDSFSSTVSETGKIASSGETHTMDNNQTSLLNEEPSSKQSHIMEQEVSSEQTNVFGQNSMSEKELSLEKVELLEQSSLSEEKSLGERSPLMEQEDSSEQTYVFEENAMLEKEPFSEKVELSDQSSLSEEKSLGEQSHLMKKEDSSDHTYVFEKNSMSEREPLSKEVEISEQTALLEEESLSKQSELTEKDPSSGQTVVFDQNSMLEKESLSEQEALQKQCPPPEQSPTLKQTFSPKKETLSKENLLPERNPILEQCSVLEQNSPPEHTFTLTQDPPPEQGFLPEQRSLHDQEPLLGKEALSKQNTDVESESLPQLEMNLEPETSSSPPPGFDTTEVASHSHFHGEQGGCEYGMGGEPLQFVSSGFFSPGHSRQDSLVVEVGEDSLSERLNSIQPDLLDHGEWLSQVGSCRSLSEWSDGEPSSKKLKTSEDIDKIEFDVLAEHRNWCPWITSVPSAKNITENIQKSPGWRILLSHLIQASSSETESDLARQNTPPTQMWKSVRRLFHDCQTTIMRSKKPQIL